ncbi:MAG: hypothetical protein J2P25_17010, partial [Nocardiopsaceae bacterium]|nr:hypothetical protein [Nocardiopsaceae bacterium]
MPTDQARDLGWQLPSASLARGQAGGGGKSHDYLTSLEGLITVSPLARSCIPHPAGQPLQPRARSLA